MNELRYKQCFQLRATRFSLPIKDFDPMFLTVKTGDQKKLQIEEFYWLKNSYTIKEWLQTIENNDSTKTLDYWMYKKFISYVLTFFFILIYVFFSIERLQLRIRYLSTDLNEIKFKDPVTFNYYYEQIKNDFMFNIAANIKNSDLIPSLLDLGCLEMR